MLAIFLLLSFRLNLETCEKKDTFKYKERRRMLKDKRGHVDQVSDKVIMY